MVMWLRPFWIRVARPMARGRQRRMCLLGALSTKAVSTKRVSRSTPGLVVRAFATALQQGGYATDPEYAGKLIKLMDRYDLYRFDK